MTEQTVIEWLHKKIIAFGSQKAFANQLGISQAYLSDILNGRRGLSDEMLTKLGLTREVTIKEQR